MLNDFHFCSLEWIGDPRVGNSDNCSCTGSYRRGHATYFSICSIWEFLWSVNFALLIERGWFGLVGILRSLLWLLRRISAMSSRRQTLLFFLTREALLLRNSQLLIAWLQKSELVLRIGLKRILHWWWIEHISPLCWIVHKVSTDLHVLLVLLLMYNCR